MSMLAEPRRKQKWSVDPRNSAWSNDESKFGQKMLERMGWSKGKGLGRTEQGSTEHVKVKVKNNNLGLGTAASHEDNWIAHQDDFNQLLADLNNCHSQNSSNEPVAEEKQGFSLEEKSKTSKKRVHYMKFTKGKDLSSRSETDLACIFGKRAKHAKDHEEGGKEEPEASAATPEADVEAICKTVSSTLTMQQYFAQRMAQLKKGCGAARGVASSQEEEEDSSGTQVPAEASDSSQNATDNTPEEPLSKKKKKKKKKSKREAVEEAVEEDALPPVTAERAEEETPSERKKKKKKRAEKDEAMDCSAAAGEEQNCEEEEETPTQKKKKKRKKNKQKDANAGVDLVKIQEPTEDVEEKKSKKDKKRKRKELD